MSSFVRIRAAIPLAGRRARIEFTDGTQRDIDLTPFLHGPIFSIIRADSSVFAALRVDAEAGTIAWPNGADIDPDVLYRGLAPDRSEREVAVGKGPEAPAPCTGAP